MAKDAHSPAARPRRRWAQADFHQRRELIVDVAVDLLARLGPQGVTVRRVAQRLGLGTMTLYTYVPGQDALRAAMIQRGFDMLRQTCDAQSTLETPQRWRGGAKAYVQFAIDHPRLYDLMFSSPVLPAGPDADVLASQFEPFSQKLREDLRRQGVPEHQLDASARSTAYRFWIALHGLASLAVSGRLDILHVNLDHILDDLLPRIAPP